MRLESNPSIRVHLFLYRLSPLIPPAPRPSVPFPPSTLSRRKPPVPNSDLSSIPIISLCSSQPETTTRSISYLLLLPHRGTPHPHYTQQWHTPKSLQIFVSTPYKYVPERSIGCREKRASPSPSLYFSVCVMVVVFAPLPCS